MTHFTPTRPVARAIAAAERATVEDQRWYKRNPGERLRIRVAGRGEFDQWLKDQQAWPLEPGSRLIVVVDLIQPGRRTRAPYCVMSQGAPVQGDLPQAESEWLREQWLKDIAALEAKAPYDNTAVAAFAQCHGQDRRLSFFLSRGNVISLDIDPGA
ncbi:hypothetical protein C0216_31075 (plasmid) [Streptomyces globosus]|uniref:Uncharacterized protein n=1 Tax=Streptomyces globosus TaxID=68209 RepID=A0A344UAM0_9ACTN|nr:hypothetical protein [Streptomyces globosus]AXE27941.1 hypothetical protein C0216_31075 [Streptomyces globosus]